MKHLLSEEPFSSLLASDVLSFLLRFAHICCGTLRQGTSTVHKRACMYRYSQCTYVCIGTHSAHMYV